MNRELTIIARITRQGPPAPLPGVYFVLSVYEYEAIEPVGEIRRGERLDVAHRIAPVDDPGFAAGRVRRLLLTDQFPPRSTLLFGEDHPRRGQVWFCSESSPVAENAAHSAEDRP